VQRTPGGAVEGPLTDEQLQQWASAAYINGYSVVCSDGATWRRATEIPGLNIAPMPQRYAAPTLGYAGMILTGVVGRTRELRWVVVASGAVLFLTIVSIVLSAFAKKPPPPAPGTPPSLSALLPALTDPFQIAGTTVSCVSALAAIGLWVYWLVWVYQVHDEMRNLTGGWYPISPGKALGFCFIPFFNLYWFVHMPLTLANEVKRLAPQAEVSSGAS